MAMWFEVGEFPSKWAAMHKTAAKEVESMIFKGEYEHTIDTKGRMFIPAKFREGLGDSFVVFKWLFDNCLYVMSNDEFENFSASLDQIPLADEDAAMVQRKLYSSACDVDLDAQKRVLIPADLRKYAGLEKDVAVVGVRTHVELWDLDTWRSKTTDTEAIRGAIRNLRESGYKI
jgi:MraZ protein